MYASCEFTKAFVVKILVPIKSFYYSKTLYIRKHRTEVHPELDEFKPVDLEPDDPDRDSDFTVACPVCERKFKHKTTCTVHIKVIVVLLLF